MGRLGTTMHGAVSSSGTPWRGASAEDSHRGQLGPELGGELRAARRRAGFTTTARGAKAAGISESHQRGMEKGVRRPSLSVAERLIETFSINPDVAGELRAVAAADAGRDFVAPAERRL